MKQTYSVTIKSMHHRIGWLIVRCLVAAFFGFGIPGMFDDPQTAEQGIGLFGFLFFMIGAVLMTQYNYWKALKSEVWRGRQKDWSVPSWFSNPFGGPAHFMHMGAYAFMFGGLAGLVQSALSGKLNLMFLFPLSAGWGILLGNTIFFAFVYKRLKAE